MVELGSERLFLAASLAILLGVVAANICINSRRFTFIKRVLWWQTNGLIVSILGYANDVIVSSTLSYIQVFFVGVTIGAVLFLIELADDWRDAWIIKTRQAQLERRRGRQ